MLARNGLAALAWTLMPAAMTAQGFEYAPGTSQYRITQVTKVTQEAMGQKMDSETSGHQLVTITLARPSKDTLALTATVDSVSQTGPMGPTPGLEKLFGMKVDARLSPAGALHTASTRDSSIAGATAMTDAVGRFLPRMRTRLARGVTWSDTTVGVVKQTGIEVDRRTVSRFAVVGDTTVAGTRSWKVTRNDSTTMSGSGMTQGQALTMEGTSIGKGAVFVSQAGTFVGGEGTEQANIKLLLSANGMEISIVQTANTRIEKVK